MQTYKEKTIERMAESYDLSVVIGFLLGENALDGIHFGDKHPEKQGSFWWRSILRDSVKQASGAEHIPALVSGLRDYLSQLNNALSAHYCKATLIGTSRTDMTLTEWSEINKQLKLKISEIESLIAKTDE